MSGKLRAPDKVCRRCGDRFPAGDLSHYCPKHRGEYDEDNFLYGINTPYEDTQHDDGSSTGFMPSSPSVRSKP